MYLVGLTGGIASGKSTVAARLVEHGAVEIDADVLARKAVEPGSQGLAMIAERWPQVINGVGELDRAKLASVVFQDQQARRELEAIVHPIIRALASEQFARQPHDAVVIYTVPLLVEANVNHPFDLVVTVEAPEDERVRRLMTTRGLTREAAESRIAAQSSASSRANRADYILNSNQPLPSLLADVDELWQIILSKALGKRGINGGD